MSSSLNYSSFEFASSVKTCSLDYLPKLTLLAAFMYYYMFFLLYKGIIAVIGGAFGQFLGGYFVSKLELTVRGILKWCMTFSIVAFGFSFVFVYTCDNGGE